MASNDREFINHMGKYIPRINFILECNDSLSKVKDDLAIQLLATLRDDLLEGFGRMEQSQFMWSEPFTDENVKIK